MRSLTDKRILITRARDQASELAAQLKALGAIPILIPTIEIVPPESYAPLDAALDRLDGRGGTPGGKTYDWLLFTSANAVGVFQERRRLRVPATLDRKTRVAARLLPARVAVIGPATARAVESIGLRVDLVPPQYVAESLAEALAPYAAGAEMLLVRAAQARDVLPVALRAAGAHVTIADAYRNQIPAASILALRSLFRSPATHPDAITFTSASTAHHLFDLLDAAKLALPSGIALASIGPITSQALRDLGHSPAIEADAPTIPELIASLVAHYSGA